MDSIDKISDALGIFTIRTEIKCSQILYPGTLTPLTTRRVYIGSEEIDDLPLEWMQNFRNEMVTLTNAFKYHREDLTTLDYMTKNLLINFTLPRSPEVPKSHYKFPIAVVRGFYVNSNLVGIDIEGLTKFNAEYI